MGWINYFVWYDMVIWIMESNNVKNFVFERYLSWILLCMLKVIQWWLHNDQCEWCRQHESRAGVVDIVGLLLLVEVKMILFQKCSKSTESAAHEL